MRKYFVRIIAFAVLAAFLLESAALAAGTEAEPELPAAETVEEGTEETGELENAAANQVESPEITESAVVYEAEAELFQCGSLTGEYTRPEEARLSEESTLYQEIYTGLKNKQGSIRLSLSGNTAGYEKQLATCFAKVVNDHPELFYVRNGYSYTNGSPVYMYPNYKTISDTEISAFNNALAIVVGQARAFASDLEKMLFVHDYLIINCAYNWDVATVGNTSNENVFNAYGVLVEGDAVCQGYALAYKLIMNELGLTCTTVSSDSMNHMWNMVQLNGQWYHMDVTWDDPVPDKQGYAGHNYFLLSDQTISDNDHKHKEWDGTMPSCASTAYESGWIFNSSIYPLHYWNGSYYYISGSHNASLNRADSLQASAEEKLTDISIFVHLFGGGYYYSSNGIVWVDDTLFYVNQNKTLTSYSLTSGKSQALGEVPFTATAAAVYSADMDGICLRYDPTANQLVASSPTQRKDLGRFSIPTYPAEWDDASAGTTQILGLSDDKKIAGVTSPGSGATLWVACYKDGRMVNVQSYTIQGAGLQLVNLNAIPAQYDKMGLMLLSNQYLPVCEAKKI